MGLCVGVGRGVCVGYGVGGKNGVGKKGGSVSQDTEHFLYMSYKS